MILKSCLRICQEVSFERLLNGDAHRSSRHGSEPITIHLHSGVTHGSMMQRLAPLPSLPPRSR